MLVNVENMSPMQEKLNYKKGQQQNQRTDIQWNNKWAADWDGVAKLCPKVQINMVSGLKYIVHLPNDM